MHRHNGYAAEEIPPKERDRALLKRLLPFAKPYRTQILLSILIVVFITFINIALPYITKMAIDRQIVPTVSTDTQSINPENGRYYEVELSKGYAANIVKKYPDLFLINGDIARISFDRMKSLDREDLKQLRTPDLSGVAIMSFAFFILSVFDFALNFFQKLIMEYTGHRLMHDLRVSLFRHIQGLSISFFSKNPVGRLVTRVTNDIQNMHDLFTTVISFIFNDICLMLGIAAVLLSINLELTIIGFLVLPFVWFAGLRFSRKARIIFRILRIKIADINTSFSETISGMKVIQLFRRESENYRKFRELNHENYLAGMDQIRLMAVFMPLIEILGTTAVASIIFYGGNRVMSGSITLGELVAFISYIRMFFSPLRDIAEKYNIVQNALSSAERIFLILDATDKLPVPSHIIGSDNTPPTVGLEKITRISFENVSFSYVPGDDVLKNIAFDLSAGESLGIVGPTGSGKTTLINLISRFYDPVSGRVTINGFDLRDLPPMTYRPKMALVMQDPFLFSGTIRDNIVSGNHPISDDILEKILVASNCMALVKRSPKGLDTLLSEAGDSISSGERQLISIARAFARNPELIVMDEATSYIDSQTEHRIQEALFNLMRDRTAVVVAHRLATVRQLDRILVIRRGRIIESGSHDSLMADKGFYYGMHRCSGDAC